MNICLFTESEISKPLAKHDERREHIVKVLHKGPGDTFDAGIIGGKAGLATITKIVPAGEENEGSLYFDFVAQGEGKPLYPLTMIIGFPRPIQLRRLLRDVAGLGVSAVHLTGTELGDKSYLKSSLVEKGAAYQMLLDGTAQAASTHVPELHMHASLAECLQAVCGQQGNAGGDESLSPAKIALDNIRPAMSLHDFLYGSHAAEQEEAAVCRPVVAAIGSERGWTDRERMLLEQSGYTRCGMGTRVLRTETAATVSASIILDAMGNLR